MRRAAVRVLRHSSRPVRRGAMRCVDAPRHGMRIVSFGGIRPQPPPESLPRSRLGMRSVRSPVRVDDDPLPNGGYIISYLSIGSAGLSSALRRAGRGCRRAEDSAASPVVPVALRAFGVRSDGPPLAVEFVRSGRRHIFAGGGNERVGTSGFEPLTSCLSSRRSKPTELCSLHKKTTCIAVSGRFVICGS